MNNSHQNSNRHTTVQIPNYQIKETIYSGSRTLVYRAVRTSDRLPVVIKLLKNPYPSFSELLSFRHQYTIAKNLNSPMIVQTYSLEPYQNGYALVMEDFGGISLKEWRARGYIQSLQEFLAIAIALCDTLDVLYQERIVHKDIKPANILINPETQQIKLIDFSIASLLPRETQTLINPNVLEGTLAYISPEQTGRMNRGIDYRTDFYSLGVTFYELLIGKLPFESNDPMELLHCHIAKNPPFLCDFNPDLPLMLGEIVRKLMAKNAEDRYQSVLGLKHDLVTCLEQWRETGKHTWFDLGQRDISDRFIIPDKLYGREAEVQTLLEAFGHVANGGAQLMLVSGFSGIGKTAVVNEVHKPIVRWNGYFIKGKYDQFQRNIPFSAFVQAFRDLIGQLLTESDAQIQQWKNNILEVVGENGQVIIEVIPELEIIIGQQPPALELSGMAAQNRFNLLFQKFTQVFSKAEHPLVMFLDDLQWADSASLKLIQLLMADTAYLLLIGAYRDNEVNSVHPLMLTLGDIQKTSATINQITLVPLNQVTVNQLVADTLKCSEILADNLSQLVYQKTQGNPFFATQFLKALHQENLIKFDSELGCWQCDISQVASQALTDDVVQFMGVQLQKLPESTQQVLQLAACIGNSFDLGNLAIVSEKSEVETAADLWKALQEGLILPSSEVYKFYQGEEGEPLALSQEKAGKQIAKYRFLHDRVQQAAYSLIPDEQKTATHLKIGELLRENLSELDLEDKLFDLVGHLNLGIELIIQPSDRQALAQLNLKAVMKARNSCAYAAARVYLQTGMKLLKTNCWQSQYELTLNFYTAAAEVAYLNGDFEGMEQMAAVVLQQAQTIFDQVEIYKIQIAAQTAQSQILEAIAVGREALSQLGVALPSVPDEAQIGKELQDLASLFQGRDIADLIDLPVMSDRTAIAAMQLLGVLFTPVIQGMPGLLPLLSATMVRLSLSFGNAPASTVGYAIHGMVLCAFLGEVETGYGYGRLALSLLERLNAQGMKSFTLTLFGAFIQHHQEALRTALPMLKDGYTAGMETGDFLSAGYNVTSYINIALFAGVDLDTLASEFAAYSAALAQMKQDSARVHSDIARKTVEHLRETVSQPDCLIGTIYDETVMLPKHQQDKDLTSIAVAYSYKLLLAYSFGNYQAAFDHITQGKSYLMAVSGLIFIPVFHFYAALTHLALVPTQPEPEQAQMLAVAVTHQTILDQWAQNAPMNHLHKWYLVEAERYRVLGEKIAASECYDKAITLAQENQFINEEALANELAAKLYLDWGKQRLAGEYMTNAYYGYARWGAKAKVADLEQRYPQLLAPILEQTRSPLSTNETIITLGSVTSTSSTTSSSSSVSVGLDLAAILKAYQTISGEIELEKLLKALVHIVIENAGADKCVFMLLESERLLIQALAQLSQSSAEKQAAKVDFYSMLLNPQSVEESVDVPIGLINTVKRSLQPTVIIDATLHPQLINDAYIQRQQPKSILCCPILHQGKLLGILYLENNLATGAFTSDRVELLNLLCSQAAISLENARLYRNSQNSAQQLTQSLAKLQASETRFQNLANNIPGMVYQFRLAADGSTSTPYVSSGCFDLYGLEPELVMAGTHSLYALHHPEDQPRIAQAIADSAQNLTPFEEEWRIILPSGTVKWIQSAARPERQADGSIIWDGAVIDISDRKQAEHELQKLAAVVENSTDFIGIAAINGEGLYLNPSGRRLVGIDSTADILNMHMSDFHSREVMAQIEQTIVPQAIQQGFSQVELHLQHLLTKGQIPVDYSIFTINDTQTNQPLYLAAICRDIRDRKFAEAALIQKSQELSQTVQDLQNAQLQIIQSEKMSALGNLVAGVAHEINNPLAFLNGNINPALDYIKDIFGLVELYQQEYPQPSAVIQDEIETIDLDFIRHDLPKLVGSMSEGVKRIQDISTSLRTFSRADSDRPIPCNIHDCLNSSLMILKHRLKANESRPEIKVITDYGLLPPVECFAGQLNQVFMNILANAIDALEESNLGRSFAEIQLNPNQITIKTYLSNDWAVIRIEDNGMGMTDAVKPKIFEHLFTTKGVGQGTGLGLAIARQIVVEKHYGKLEMNSTFGQGTEFAISIPVKANRC